MDYEIFVFGMFSGFGWFIVHDLFDYLIHRSRKICPDCGRPYKEVKK